MYPKFTAIRRQVLLVLTSVVLVCLLSSPLGWCAPEKEVSDQGISVRGDVEKSLNLSLADLKAMDPLYVKAVAVLKEKQNQTDKEALIEVADYRGALLRDVLLKAGMVHKRKYEPAVFIRVKGWTREVVFSFGEIFYSSIGRSTLLAYEKNGRPITASTGCPELIVSNDIREGRRISGVSQIVVERTDIEMKVYDERKKGIVQPPTSHFQMTDKKSGKTFRIVLEDLKALPGIRILDKVQIGDCEGFHDVYSYKGIPLRALMEEKQFVSVPYEYNRFIAITSKSGFCATYSIGELFNSRLGNNIVIAYEKDGETLDKDEGFAMMVAEEDNTGGRSVKCISDMYFY